MKDLPLISVLYGMGKDLVPDLRHIDWNKLPERLQDVYSPKTGLYTLQRGIGLGWRNWMMFLRAGFHTDLASYPWWGRLLGASKYSKTGWSVLPALFHDPLYRGCAYFVKDHGENRQLADQFYRDCATFRNGPKIAVARDYVILRVFGRFVYRPQPDLQDSGIMTIMKVGTHE